MDPTEPLHAHLGPEPFVFRPTHSGLQVPAFSRSFRALAWLMVAGLGVWMARSPESIHSPAALWGILAWALMAVTVWAIERSRTRLDQDELVQTWLWNKRMPVRELAYARLIRFAPLDWLIAPRLYLRNLTGRFTVIYCADPRVLEDMQRLCTELAAFRKRA